MIAFEGIGADRVDEPRRRRRPASPRRSSRRPPGWLAAIPAVFFYNYLTQRVKLFASEMDDFAMEFLNIAERNFT